jgi:uncharacterized membrane protein
LNGLIQFRFPVLLRCLLASAGLAPWLLVALKERGLLLRPVFHALCHQFPERTLVMMGVPMLVCSRCAGIYAGMAIGALLPSFGLLVRHGRRLLLVALGAMLLDVLLQDAGLRPSSHISRLSTGLLVGWSASAFLFATLGKPIGRDLSA